MVRTLAHKYIRFRSGEEELYDLSRDPLERLNLARDPAHREVKRDLQARMFEWLFETEDPLDHYERPRLLARFRAWEKRGPGGESSRKGRP